MTVSTYSPRKTVAVTAETTRSERSGRQSKTEIDANQPSEMTIDHDRRGCCIWNEETVLSTGNPPAAYVAQPGVEQGSCFSVLPVLLRVQYWHLPKLLRRHVLQAENLSTSAFHAPDAAHTTTGWRRYSGTVWTELFRYTDLDAGVKTAYFTPERLPPEEVDTDRLSKQGLDRLVLASTVVLELAVRGRWSERERVTAGLLASRASFVALPSFTLSLLRVLLLWMRSASSSTTR